jgi:hypothetical protein
MNMTAEAAKGITRKGYKVWLSVTIAIVGAGVLTIARYGNNNLTQFSAPLTELEMGNYSGKSIEFRQVEETNFDVSIDWVGTEIDRPVILKNIDLSLFIPTAPLSVRGNSQLQRWFILEREFNRQKVVFSANSNHLQLPDIPGYRPEELSVSLTNNCLSAGYWEFAVTADRDGKQTKLYQGYFSFPIGRYKKLFETYNKASYWMYLPTLEAWKKPNFMSGVLFDLSAVRSARSESPVEADSLRFEKVLVLGEQKDKEKLILEGKNKIDRWQDLLDSQIAFQSFVAPGTYEPQKPFNTHYGEISRFKGVILRKIESPLSQENLHEIQLNFQNTAGESRKLIISGVKLEDIPKLPVEQYSKGIYRPLGFGTPFTQKYEELKQNPPTNSSFFSVLLDKDDRIIDYRHDVGLNGVVLHRDIDSPNLLHLYLLSYERITLVNHYLINLESSPPT